MKRFLELEWMSLHAREVWGAVNLDNILSSMLTISGEIVL